MSNNNYTSISSDEHINKPSNEFTLPNFYNNLTIKNTNNLNKNMNNLAIKQQMYQKNSKFQNNITNLNNNTPAARDIGYQRNSNIGKGNMHNMQNNSVINNNNYTNCSNSSNYNTHNSYNRSSNYNNSSSYNNYNNLNNNNPNNHSNYNNYNNPNSSNNVSNNNSNNVSKNNSNNANNYHPTNASINNYSLGLFIDNPQNAFVFDENDLKTLLSYYNGEKSIRILKDKAAAQITFHDQNMIKQIKKDINGLTINNIGTIRCIILNEGKAIEQFLPFSANDPVHLQNSNSLANNENTVNMLKKLSSLLQPQNSPSIKKKKDINLLIKNQIVNKTNHTNFNNSNNNFNSLHNQNDNPYANKRLSRIELIDIFGFPSEFDVMKKILGKNNSNIIYLNDQTNNNVKIEIKGKPLNEAPVIERMHISLSSDDAISYKKGVDIVTMLLNSIFKEFYDFCIEKNCSVPENLAFKKHEYTYNADGTTKYLGFKEKSPLLKENYKNDYVYKKNKNVQKIEKDKRNTNSGFNMYPGPNIQYSNQNTLLMDFKETNYKESNQGNFRNIKLNRARD